MAPRPPRADREEQLFEYTGAYIDQPMFPTREELLNKPDDLNGNIVSKPYPSVEVYLETMYRLLREDMFGPLREGISEHQAQVASGVRVGAGTATCGSCRALRVDSIPLARVDCRSSPYCRFVTPAITFTLASTLPLFKCCVNRRCVYRAFTMTVL
jgi:hypothetical protein